MAAMQQQIDLMSAMIQDLQKIPPQNQAVPISTSSNHADARWTNRGPVSPSYIGPTSSEFGLNVSNDAAAHLDETEISENIQISSSNSPSALPEEPREKDHIDISRSDNPLLSLTEADALRLVDVFDEAVALMYPVVDLKSIREYIVDFYRQPFDGSNNHLCPPQNGNEVWWFSARDTEVLKIVLALALISESNGKCELGDVLAASVENTFASTRTQVPEVDMKELIILTLVVSHF